MLTSVLVSMSGRLICLPLIGSGWDISNPAFPGKAEMSAYAEVLLSYTEVLSGGDKVLLSYIEVLQSYTEVLSGGDKVLLSYIEVLRSASKFCQVATKFCYLTSKFFDLHLKFVDLTLTRPKKK